MQLIDLTLVALWRPRLLTAQLHFLTAGLGRSPYRVEPFEQRLNQQKKPFIQDDYVYGETPWWTLRKILKRLAAQPGESFFDLGSGTGRVVLGAVQLGRLRGYGYEQISTRHHLACHVLAPELRAKKIQLQLAESWHAPLDQAQLVLLTWTCMAPASRQRIVAALMRLAKGARIATVTHPIEDNSEFIFLAQQRLCFSWGRGDVYFYRRA